MNKKNLIMTPTGKMTREEWLAFRQPLTHVNNFISTQMMAAPKYPADGMARYKFLLNMFKKQEWKDFLFPCIGASEVAAIMGLNPWKASIEMYFEKVGAKDTFDGQNAAMFWGKDLEATIADKWQYWDGSADGMMMNYDQKNIIRKCRRVNFYIQNKKFPWLFASLDRLINKAGESEEGALECKTISGFAQKMWESGIPPMYVAQLQTQLGVAELPYGELATLKDGRFMEVEDFERSKGIIDRIIEESHKFFQQVKSGIECYLLHLSAPTDELKQAHYADMDRLAPGPDGSEAYKAYLSDTYKNASKEGLLGGPEQTELAKEYQFYAGRVKSFEILKTEAANKLKAFMKDASKMEVEGGSVSWNNNVHGTRTFTVRMKLDPAYEPASFKEPVENFTE